MRRFELHGNIYNADGSAVQYTVSGDDIVQGSFSFSNQLCDSRAVTVGGVYMGEMHMTLAGDSWSGNLLGRRVVMKQGLGDDPEAFDVLTLGNWFIKEAAWHGRFLELTCYDGMCLLDKKWYGENTKGYANKAVTPFEIYSLICSECGVEAALSKAKVEALPNGSESLTLYYNGESEVLITWRDVLSHLAAALGCFACFNRFGKLTLRRFGLCNVTAYDSSSHQMVDTEHTNSSPAEIIPYNYRVSGGTFGNEPMSFTEVSVSIAETGESVSEVSPVNNGFSMDLGENAFLQSSTGPLLYRVYKAVCDNLVYSGCTVLLSDVSMYDLGDIIELSEGGEVIGDDILMCVMKVDYTFGRGGSITCFAGEGSGGHSVKSTAERAAASSSSNAARAMSVITPNEVLESAVADGGSAAAAVFNFTCGSGFIVFVCTLNFAVAETVSGTPCTLSVSFLLDGDTLEALTQDYGSGAQVLTLSYGLDDVSAGTEHEFKVMLSPAGGSLS